MTLNPVWLFLSLIPGGAGFVLLVYGKKEQRWPYIVAGLAFIIYPYFTPGIASLLGVGALLAAALWCVVREGW
jgi:hypothetical protein